MESSYARPKPPGMPIKALLSLTANFKGPLRSHLPRAHLVAPKIPAGNRRYGSSADHTYSANQSHGSPTVSSFFERNTSTWQHIVSDPVTRDAALIDTVLDYDLFPGAITTTTADKLVDFIREHGLNIKYVLETHAHADHLTAAQYYRTKFDVPVGIGKRISTVQKTFASVYGFSPSAFDRAFDLLFDDDEEFKIGNLACRVIHLPGHTPDHVGYVIGESVFTGDSIFQPDVGSARSDFPGGDAKTLYSSMRRLMDLPDSFRLFVGHDYPTGRQQLCTSTVGEQRQSNRHIKEGVSEAEFTSFRTARDSILGPPRLLHQSLQTNIRGGRLPADGCFKIPFSASVAL
ncbi:Metallo-hydrolase/oxidoreductase [Mycena filopes]|nr:Metallo-hydrolase/oxidoreductase [Mycena filopes]